MQRHRAALSGLLLCIWIALAAGCAGRNIAQSTPAGSAEAASGTEAVSGTEAASGTEMGDAHICWAAVTLEGGSGRASVDSPCPVFERPDAGERVALITWSSSYYDYMVVGGEKILPVNTGGNSQFEIPLGGTGGNSGQPENCTLEVQADTTAMSTPHLVDYTLSFRFYGTQEEAREAGNGAGVESGPKEQKAEIGRDLGAAPEIPGLQYLSEDEREYAQCFAIYRYENGYAALSVDDGRRYLIVPEGAEIPDGVNSPGAEKEGDLIVLQKPLDHIYLAASAAMCQFDEIDAVQNVILSGLERDDWYIEAARAAMDKGTLQYGGKYSAPDYERIVASGVNLAVESTMILHTPKVQEKLEKLGIPVLIDRSSYEGEPLGRAEWVKVYGLLTGREEEAAKAFAEQKGYVEKLLWDKPDTGKSVAIFSINSTRQVVTRSKGDYFGRMVEIAGAQLCTPATDDGRATQTVSMEAFYAAAQGADFLIYNASIEDAPQSLEQMCAKDNILAGFRAVSEGNVWCMRSLLYQNASRTGAIMRDLNAIVTGQAGDETEFFYKLR